MVMMCKKNKTKIYKRLPKDWEITKNTTTEPKGFYWISNKESRFSGKRKIALLKK